MRESTTSLWVEKGTHTKDNSLLSSLHNFFPHLCEAIFKLDFLRDIHNLPLYWAALYVIIPN